MQNINKIANVLEMVTLEVVEEFSNLLRGVTSCSSVQKKSNPSDLFVVVIVAVSWLSLQLPKMYLIVNTG